MLAGDLVLKKPHGVVSIRAIYVRRLIKSNYLHAVKWNFFSLLSQNTKLLILECEASEFPEEFVIQY